MPLLAAVLARPLESEDEEPALLLELELPELLPLPELPALLEPPESEDELPPLDELPPALPEPAFCLIHQSAVPGPAGVSPWDSS